MHKNEFSINTDLIRHLINTQFPQYAHLSITLVPSSGTDNAIYRLGNDMCVRLARIVEATHYNTQKNSLLSHIAPRLPLTIPTLIARGNPTKYYPWHWSIYTWIDGEPAIQNCLFNEQQAAVDLAHFLNALQKIEANGIPPSPRAIPLIAQGNKVQTALTQLHDDIDTHAAKALWEKCMNAPVWDKKPVLIHGDLLPTNILVHNNRINGIIDFDFFGTGDPACDLLPAWSMFSADARKTFRTKLDVDNATWLRGQGWALSIALIIIPYYKNTNPTLVAIAQHMIHKLLRDFNYQKH